jgi:hypothetical protein
MNILLSKLILSHIGFVLRISLCGGPARPAKLGSFCAFRPPGRRPAVAELASFRTNHKS